jgi:hypothetical protein
MAKYLVRMNRYEQQKSGIVEMVMVKFGLTILTGWHIKPHQMVKSCGHQTPPQPPPNYC